MKRVSVLAVLVAAALYAFTAPADAATLSCGQTITQSTTLDNDLSNCPGHGVVIGASDITLDLNGHTIDGDETIGSDCESQFTMENGVENAGGHDGITIENGTIQEFVIGVSGGYGHSVMRDLTLRSNAFSGIIIGAFADNIDANAIERNLVTANGCGGIGIFGVNGIRIEGNTVTDTQAGNFGGIIFDGCTNAQITSNTVSGNTGGAIGGGGNDGNTIAGNTISDNGDGIFLFDGSDNNLVEQNSATRNDAGVVIDRSNQNEVTGNSLFDNLLVGVLVVGGDDNRITNNSIFRNSDRHEGGIHLASNQGDGSDRTVVSNNTLRANQGDGILVDQGQTGTMIDGNRSDRNFDDGIDVKDRATTLRKNTANFNRDLGIEAANGVTDGGGNKARGNRDPRQCVNVRCK